MEENKITAVVVALLQVFQIHQLQHFYLHISSVRFEINTCQEGNLLSCDSGLVCVHVCVFVRERKLNTVLLFTLPSVFMMAMPFLRFSAKSERTSLNMSTNYSRFS